ncbi:FAD-dependent oxidoreductase [Luteimonas sp. A482]
MIDDFSSPACPDAFDADVCIIGGGPAGITIAAELANTPWKVCLLEGGGLRSERASQALNAGESIGPHALDPAFSRLRTFGGSTRLWGGGCIPMSSIEMARREWVPESGWPIEWDALASYYARANKVCRVDPGDFGDGTYLSSGNGDAPSPNLDNRTSRISPLDFGQAHMELLRTSPNLQLVLHANVLRLEALDNASAVRRALIGTTDGRRGHVNARYFVLATGGIENARLLLLSDDVAPAGLGNDRDLVGRYFMDHPRCGLGTFRAGAMDQLANLYSRALDDAPCPAYHQLSLSASAQQSHRLLNARARPFAVEQPASKGLASLRALRASLRGKRGPADESQSVENEVLDALAQEIPERIPAYDGPVDRGRLALRTALNAGDIFQAGRRKLARRSVVDTDRVEMVGYFEQAPNRDSRILLSDDRDALGLRKVRMDWRLSAADQASIRGAANLISADVATRFECEFEPADWLRDASAVPHVHGTAHHIGTTRMADSPEDGVVDTQCRVHGVDNLYVAGSSVFPTGGWAFPTLTIVALALRVTDELRNRLNEVPVAGTL